MGINSGFKGLIRTQSNTTVVFVFRSVSRQLLCLCEWSCSVLQMNIQRTEITSRARN